METNQPRKKRLFSTLVRAYRSIGTHPHRYELEASLDVPLIYCSDGSTQIHGGTVISTAPIPDRLDLVNLQLSRRNMRAPVHIVISADDYKAHQKAVHTYQKDNPL